VARCRRRTFAHLSPRQRGRYYCCRSWTCDRRLRCARHTHHGRQRHRRRPHRAELACELPEKMLRIDAPTPVVWIIGGRRPTGRPTTRRSTTSRTPCRHAAVVVGVRRTLGRGHTDPDLEENAETSRRRRALGRRVLLARRRAHGAPPTASQRLVDGGAPRAHRLDARAPVRPEPGVRRTLGEVPAAAQALLASRMPRLANVVNGWQMNPGHDGRLRQFLREAAIVTKVGLGRPGEDLVYPLLVADADGAALDVAHATGSTSPPTPCRPWTRSGRSPCTTGAGSPSPTSSTATRWANRDPLDYNADGSLDIWIAMTTGPARVANWLPCPEAGSG